MIKNRRPDQTSEYKEGRRAYVVRFGRIVPVMILEERPMACLVRNCSNNSEYVKPKTDIFFSVRDADRAMRQLKPKE